MTGAHRQKLEALRVLVTRAPEQAGKFVARLRAEGAVVVELPLVQFAPPTSWEEADAAIAELASFDWIVFASSNAVRFFLERVRGRKRDLAVVGSAQLAAVGESTAEALRTAGLQVDLVPGRHSARGLLEEFSKRNVAGKRFLLPRAQEGRKELVSGLLDLGAQVRAVPVYRTVAPWHDHPKQRSQIQLSDIDVLTLFSPSAVRHLLELVSVEEVQSRHEAGMRIAVIGPTTRDTALGKGLPVDILPESATSEALIRALVAAAGRHIDSRSGGTVAEGSATAPSALNE